MLAQLAGLLAHDPARGEEVLRAELALGSDPETRNRLMLPAARASGTAARTGLQSSRGGCSAMSIRDQTTRPEWRFAVPQRRNSVVRRVPCTVVCAAP